MHLWSVLNTMIKQILRGFLKLIIFRYIFLKFKITWMGGLGILGIADGEGITMGDETLMGCC